MKQSTYFISHGAPDLVVKPIAAHQFLRQLGEKLRADKGLKGIVMVSAHWQQHQRREHHHQFGSQNNRVLLERNDRPGIQYDFGGFGPELHQYQYDIHSHVDVRQAVIHSLEQGGWQVEQVDRPVDHGSWVPLAVLDKEAEIPVVNISLPAEETPQATLALGNSLASLREQGIAIIGSGAITHNLSILGREGAEPPEWALDFAERIGVLLSDGNIDAIAALFDTAEFRFAHPTPEHFLPLLVAAGAGVNFENGVQIFNAEQVHQSFSYQTIAMDAYRFG